MSSNCSQKIPPSVHYCPYCGGAIQPAQTSLPKSVLGAAWLSFLLGGLTVSILLEQFIRIGRDMLIHIEIETLCVGLLSGMAAISGTGLLLGKNWGRKFAIFHCTCLLLFSAYVVVVAGTNAMSAADYSKIALRYSYFFMFSFGLAIVNLINLISHDIKDYYMPSNAPHAPDQSLNMLGSLYIILGFWLILPVPVGVGLLVRRKWSWKMSYYIAGIVGLLALLLTPILWFVPDAEFFAVFLPVVSCVLLPAWLYLRRADVQAVFLP